MTPPKATFAGLALIAVLCAGVILGLTTPAWAGLDEGKAAYERGDYATAIREWRPLAKQGYAIAQNDLGVMFSKSVDDLILDGQQDDATVVKRYRKAAEQCVAEAQSNLGFMYDKGLGVTHGDTQAHMWFNLAASSFPPGEDRDTAVENRDNVASSMTPAQISEAQKLAREWKPK